MILTSKNLFYNLLALTLSLLFILNFTIIGHADYKASDSQSYVEKTSLNNIGDCGSIALLLDYGVLDDKPKAMDYSSTTPLSSCLAGGPGASECSLEAAGISCSVTCPGEDVYACCGIGCVCRQESEREEI